MKKYIISEEALQNLYLSSCIMNDGSFNAFVVNCGNSIQEYKEPEQDMHYVGGQWYAKTGESQAVAQNVNTPKFKQGDVVYFLETCKVPSKRNVSAGKVSSFSNGFYKLYFEADRYSEERLFRTPEEAFKKLLIF